MKASCLDAGGVHADAFELWDGQLTIVNASARDDGGGEPMSHVVLLRGQLPWQRSLCCCLQKHKGTASMHACL